MRKAEKPNFGSRIALSSSVYKVGQMNCKTFIHRFDSDRRLHSHQQLTSSDQNHQVSVRRERDTKRIIKPISEQFLILRDHRL